MTDKELLQHENQVNKTNLRYEIVKLLVNVQQTPNVLSEAENLYKWITDDSNKS